MKNSKKTKENVLTEEAEIELIDLRTNPLSFFLKNSASSLVNSFLPKLGLLIEFYWYSQDEQAISYTAISFPLQMMVLSFGDFFRFFTSFSLIRKQKTTNSQLLADILRLAIIVAVLIAIICFATARAITSVFSRSFQEIESTSNKKLFAYFVVIVLPFHVIKETFVGFLQAKKLAVPCITEIIIFLVQQFLCIAGMVKVAHSDVVYIPLAAALCDLISIIVFGAFIHYKVDDLEFDVSYFKAVPEKESRDLLLGNATGLVSPIIECMFYFLLLHFLQKSVLQDAIFITEAFNFVSRLHAVISSFASGFAWPTFLVSKIANEVMNYKFVNSAVIYAAAISAIWFIVVLPTVFVAGSRIINFFLNTESYSFTYATDIFKVPLYGVAVSTLTVPLLSSFIGMKNKFSLILLIEKSLTLFISLLYLALTNSYSYKRYMYSFLFSEVCTLMITLCIGMREMSICFHSKDDENTDEAPLSG